MSLAEVVLEIAQEMEEAESTQEEQISPHQILSWVKQLRLAVKASQGSPPPPPLQDPIRAALAQAEKRELEAGGKFLEKQVHVKEALNPNHFFLVDGPMDGTPIPVQGVPPVGARTGLGGYMYEFDGKVFKYSEELTEALYRKQQSDR